MHIAVLTPRRALRRARRVAAVVRDRRPPPVAVIMLARSGLVDPSWYARQVGGPVGGPWRTAVDQVVRGRRRGWSPNPLFEPEWVMGAPGYAGRRDPLARYLGGRSANGGPGPWFDDARWLQEHPEARRHRGGSLGHFLSVAGPATAVPVPVGSPDIDWGSLQERLLAEADFVRSQDAHLGRRTTTHWDAARERDYLVRWNDEQLPQVLGPPLVSIVLPVRNRPVAVAAAIASVRAQTFADWELLVVDDGSDDETADVAERSAVGDQRVRVVRTNGVGAAAARNVGVEVATGRYLAFLDSDNVWVPHFLRVMVAAMTGQGLRAAHAVVELRSGRKRRWLAHEGGWQDLLVANHVDLNTLVLETELAREAGAFDPSLRRMIDWDLALRVVRRTPLVLLPFVGVHYEESGLADRISVREPDTWSEAVLARALLPRAVGDPVPGRVTVVVHVKDDWSDTSRAVRELLDRSAGSTLDVQVVLSDGGSTAATWRILSACLGGESRVVRRRSPRDRRWALESMLGVAAGDGEIAILAPTNTVPTWPTVQRLVAGLEPSVALVGTPELSRTGSLAAAGWGLVSGRPVPLLADFPLADVTNPAAVPTVGGGALGVRVADLFGRGGPDPLFADPRVAAIDLSLRLTSASGGACVVVAGDVSPWGSFLPAAPEADLAELGRRWPGDPGDPGGAELWHRRGLAAKGVSESPSGPRVEVIREPAPGLRWAIKIAAPAGPRGDAWGDTPFAAALAAELELRGQFVAVDRREAHGRKSAGLDDVVLNIRGLDRIVPDPDQVNLLWVISHPDQLTREELAQWDVVFAASEPWSRATSEAFGIPVRPLLQATDPRRFNPGLAAPDTGEPVLFVGNSRGVYRPIIRDALAARLDVAVYGGNWAGFLPPRHLRADFLANDKVGAAYRSAGVVLNDHWPDMAREGFISNRVFDAVASGARVVSDQVHGIEDLFGGAVRTYRSAAELSALAGPERTRAFPGDAARRAIAERVAREHSFGARAESLLAAALEVRAVRIR